MKKILTLTMTLALATGSVFAASSYTNALKNAIKQDVQSTKQEAKEYNQSVKEAIRKDIEANKKAQKEASEAKKAAKIKEIQAKIDSANKELKEVKNSSNLTFTEKTLKTKALEKQIEFLNKQKAAIK